VARSLSAIALLVHMLGLIRAPITGTPPLRYVGTVTKYFSSSAIALGELARDARVSSRGLF